MVSNGFPNITTSGQQDSIEEKPSIIYCTLISISMQGHQNHNIFYLFRSSGLQKVVVIRSYMVLEKLNKFTNIST